MKIKDQLTQIRDTLDGWARGHGGRVFIASDPYHLVTLLRENPKAMRCGLMFHGESKRGDYEERGAVDRTFWVVCTRGQGLKLEPGASLVEGSAGGVPLFDLVEEARQIIRGIQFDPGTTETTPNYLGTEPFNTEGYLVDAYRIEFSIGVQLPAPDAASADV